MNKASATEISVASDFLQSVVLVDDEAEFASWHEDANVPLDDSELEVSPRRKPQVARTPRQSHANRLDAKLVADGFAERGIVCAILQPGRDEELTVTARTVTVARRADILVLDWDFFGDEGSTAINLLLAVLREDASDQRRRLVAIYTADPSLRAIAGRIHSELRHLYGAVVRRKTAFVVDAAVARVVIYAKPESRIRGSMRAARQRVVAYEKLPEVLIVEFATWSQGLVSNLALKSVAAVRANTHQLLQKLPAELDAAYLWHRAVLVEPIEAEEHLVSIVASEFRAILDDTNVRSAAALPAIREWLERDTVADYSVRFGESGHRSRQDVLDLLRFGTAGESEDSKRMIQRFGNLRTDKAHKKSASLAGFAASVPAALRANEQFALLTSLRTQYRRPLPRLALGTIISYGKGAARRYWVCLQPRCDSVRLAGSIAFPMLPLDRVTEGPFHVLLPAMGRKEAVRLAAKPKPSRLQMIHFVAPPSAGCIFADDSSQRFTFVDSKQRRYRWEGELKFEHGQRLAEVVAREFSRVGLTESEWLRLWAK
jgi:hypothetical protein